MALQRLQKILAQAGIASRRSAERLILDGRVRVNGRIISELGARANPMRDRVEVDGKRLVAERLVYFLIHKPRGVVTTLDDPEGRPSIADSLRNVSERVFPVGRLDFQTSGALLLTNDGALTQSLLHPTRRVPKVYHAKVSGTLDAARLELLRNGVTLDDGEQTAPAEVDIVRKDDKHTFIQVTISEGKNRQIHRMLDAVGRVVLRLTRTAFAGLALDKLRPGEMRALTQPELNDLKQLYLNPSKKPRPGRGANPYREPEFEVVAADSSEAPRARPVRYVRGVAGVRPDVRGPARGGQRDGGRQTGRDEQRPRKYAARDERQSPHREDARREPLRVRKFGARDEQGQRGEFRHDVVRDEKQGRGDGKRGPRRDAARDGKVRDDATRGQRRDASRDQQQGRGDLKRGPRRDTVRGEQQVGGGFKRGPRREPVRDEQQVRGDFKRGPRREPVRDEQQVRGDFKRGPRREPVRDEQQVRGDFKRGPRREPARDEQQVGGGFKRGPRREPARDEQQVGGGFKRGPRREPARDEQQVRGDFKRGPRRDAAENVQQTRGDFRRGARGVRDSTPDARRQRDAATTDDSRVRTDATRNAQRIHTHRGAFPRGKDPRVDTTQPARKRTRNR